MTLLEDLVDAASCRVDYADARLVRTRRERVAVRDGAVEALDRGEDEGVGVRVRVGGAWGFAATRESTSAGAEAALQRALEVARSQPASAGGELAPEPPT
ncbi:MAG: TldD/PmbA family protein, partial [Thermoleophilaceae bacterium]|nr:TldD/PmbA family protein [Thermoleophilaceae bacterium]